MKVLDPQSALLTTSEVHEFLLQNPPRATPRKIGSYAPVSLKGYRQIRDDFQDYVFKTVPHIAKYPPPATFVKNVVPKLRTLGLTKTETIMAINLGIGLPRGQQDQQLANESENVKGVTLESVEEDAAEARNADSEHLEPTEEDSVDTYQPSDMELLSCIIEELDDRYPGEEGQAQIQQILATIREEYERAHSLHASTNGDAHHNEDAMDVS